MSGRWDLRSNTEQSSVFTWLVQAWKEQHGKSYSTSSHTEGLADLTQDETLRMKIWIENKAEIEKHNKEFNEVKKNEE